MYDAFINNPELLKGRTIKNVYYSSMSECLIFVFDDNSYFHVCSRGYYEGGTEIIWTEIPEDRDKFEAGLMTKEEYKAIEEYHEKVERERLEKAEYNNFLRLKDKFDSK